MVLPLIAGIALKGLASNAIGGALGGQQQGASNPINSIFGGDDQQKQGQKDGIGSLINTLLDPLGILGLGKNEDEQNQQQMPPMGPQGNKPMFPPHPFGKKPMTPPPFGKKPMMPPPPMPMMNFMG